MKPRRRRMSGIIYWGLMDRLAEVRRGPSSLLHAECIGDRLVAASDDYENRIEARMRQMFGIGAT